MNGAKLATKDGVAFWQVPGVAAVGVRAAFFQRHGGLGQDRWKGLNCGFNCGDDPDTVLANRRRAQIAGGFGPLEPALVKQVHGRAVIMVGPEQAAQGWRHEEEMLPEADGLLTTSPGLPLAIKTADCLPVMLIHPQGRAVAIVHAGWKGLVKGIITEGIKKLQHTIKTPANSLLAVLGPCLGPSHFRITAELFDVFMALSPDIITIKGDYALVDMQRAAQLQLKGEGLASSNIITIPECTFEKKEDYFSHRRDHGQTGRMLSMIQIDE